MDEEQTIIQQKQICSIRIAFPVESDEQAIEYKKKIGNIVSGIESMRLSFDLTTMPVQIPKPNGNV